MPYDFQSIDEEVRTFFHLDLNGFHNQRESTSGENNVTERDIQESDLSGFLGA